MFVIINGNKNYLPFAIPSAPGYGIPTAQSPTCTSLYSDQATAVSRLGSAGLQPLIFYSNVDTIWKGDGSLHWAWSWSSLFVTYFGRTGTLMGLFRYQQDAQKYAAALGAGYTTAACSLSAN